MDRDTAQAVTYMGEQVYSWMESNLSSYNVGFEFLPEQSPALMLQSQITDPVLIRYKSGRVVYRYPFALYLRMDNSDTANRIQNQADLQSIADSFLGATLNLTGFALRKIEQDTTVRVMTTEQGMDVCMVTLHVDYERSGAQ